MRIPMTTTGHTMEKDNQPNHYTNTTARIPKRFFVLLCFVGVATMSYLSISKSQLGSYLVDREIPNDPSQLGSYLVDREIPHDPWRPVLDRWTTNAYELASELSKSPWRASLPSPERPFVFFHIRKGGGSSLRTILFRSSKMHGLDHWIPCMNGTRCVPFSLPLYNEKQLRKAVYVGHLNWSHMAQLMRETTRNVRDRDQPTTNRTFKINDDHETERTNVYLSLRDDDRQHSFGSCLANIRPTVSRVVSCWNFRFVQAKRGSWNLPVASSMTVEEWETLLSDAVDSFGNGCNNEMYRIFGSTQHEPFVNKLSVETYGATHYLDELETVLGRMAKCVMIRVDRCADSITILKHFLPWIDAGDLCQKREKISTLPTNITNEAEEAILAQNTFDDLVVQFGAELFEAQLKVARDGRRYEEEEEKRREHVDWPS